MAICLGVIIPALVLGILIPSLIFGIRRSKLRKQLELQRIEFEKKNTEIIILPNAQDDDLKDG